MLGPGAGRREPSRNLRRTTSGPYYFTERYLSRGWAARSRTSGVWYSQYAIEGGLQSMECRPIKRGAAFLLVGPRNKKGGL
jgi:hypothetical protein